MATNVVRKGSPRVPSGLACGLRTEPRALRGVFDAGEEKTASDMVCLNPYVGTIRYWIKSLPATVGKAGIYKNLNCGWKRPI
ncbi:hypothetical protein KMAL_11710 [Novacetimonas maltaceti]|uniref:Uncharacterized protein n=1 Tax=Novacetimonas maltaceti TaxID=1203393 RepID=A0A2S3W3X2_9PROT|nr:hypothetical protein KMAL_11710 [Novacetimonas maltaceti]